MPQLNKGGKFVFGISKVQTDFNVQVPTQAISEYKITRDSKVILFTGSKITGGFCVTNKTLLAASKLKHILVDCPQLAMYELPECEFIRYKGRGYCWARINEAGLIHLTQDALKYLNISVEAELLSIRSSDIAFTMGAKGPLLDKAHAYQGVIEQY